MTDKSKRYREYKKLTRDDRVNILSKIVKGKTLTEIASDLAKEKSTILREVQKNRYFPIHPQTCSYCTHKVSCNKCIGISQIRWICPNFEPLLCKRQEHFPYVCNGCEKQTRCNHARCYYNCDESFDQAREHNTSCHRIKHVDHNLMQKINEIVSAGVKKGQSVHAIYESNEWLKSLVSELTIRRYLYDGCFDVKAWQLRRYKSFRHSKKYDYSWEKRWSYNIEAKENRTFQDFIKFKIVNKIEKHYWEWDSVEGNANSKFSILTATYAKFPFMLCFKIKKHNSFDVLDIVRNLQNSLGDKFSEIFAVNLCDNGVEFSQFHKAEVDSSGKKICNVFFTNPYKSNDKPHCERNHEFIRYIAPKGTSFDDWTNEDIQLMMNHINSYLRTSLNNKTPYELFVKEFSIEVSSLLKSKHINNKDVDLTFNLIKKHK